MTRFGPFRSFGTKDNARLAANPWRVKSGQKTTPPTEALLLTETLKTCLAPRQFFSKIFPYSFSSQNATKTVQKPENFGKI